MMVKSTYRVIQNDSKRTVVAVKSDWARTQIGATSSQITRLSPDEVSQILNSANDKFKRGTEAFRLATNEDGAVIAARVRDNIYFHPSAAGKRFARTLKKLQITVNTDGQLINR